MHTQPASLGDCKILQGKTTVSHCFQDFQGAYASVFLGRALLTIEISVWEEGKRLPKTGGGGKVE